jgi:hypothetical protein
MAVVASILTAIYHICSRTGRRIRISVPTTSIATPPTSKKRLVNRLADLGCALELKPLAA